MATCLEGEWNSRGDIRQNLNRARRIAEMGCWFHIGFCLGLRGEEHVQIEFAGSARSLRNLEGDPSYITIVVVGRTKGNQTSGHKFSIPCLGTTGKSGLKVGMWLKRLVWVRVQLGDGQGWLFQRNGEERSRVGDFEEDFFGVLERLQADGYSGLQNCNIREEYGILRSLRRGNTSHCLNMGVDPELIRTFNRWRSQERAGGQMPRLDMIGTYAEWEAILPTLLKVSQAL